MNAVNRPTEIHTLQSLASSKTGTEYCSKDYLSRPAQPELALTFPYDTCNDCLCGQFTVSVPNVQTKHSLMEIKLICPQLFLVTPKNNSSLALLVQIFPL